MRAATLTKAGLRPMGAYVMLGAGFLVIVARIAFLAETHAAGQPDLTRTNVGAAPAYRIADRNGEVLARFAPRFDLEVSPRALWQAHTPERILPGLEEALGEDWSLEELTELLFPDARDGVIRVDSWELSARQANEVLRFVDGNEDEGPIPGIWVEPNPTNLTTYQLIWRPLEVLSLETRKGRGMSSAWSFGRHFANGIAAALRDPSEPEPVGGPQRDAMREEIWSALIPCVWSRAIRGIGVERVAAVRDLLASEGVSSWQMRLGFGRDRVWPTGRPELLGDWGYRDESDTEAVPRTGLELLARRELDRDIWRERLDFSVPVYHWLADRTVRGSREPGYLAFEHPAQPPTVVATLDISLQAFLHAELERLVAEHEPAVAEAIVLDVDTGDVLAVDSVERYPLAPFAPIYHVFTTGSTMKVVTMASALEEGVVDPSDTLDVGHGAYRVIYPDGRPSGRVIHEAEGALQGEITASQALAYSVNAGMVQIGLQIPDRAFHGYLERLGYGKKPGSGLGPERAGHLAALPWSYSGTHASISFGHEISSTLWQHAAGLATVVRGGVFRPLRILGGVSQNDRSFALPIDAGTRIFSPETCAQVLDMMRLGALEGTGRKVRREFLELAARSLGIDVEQAAARFDLASKTGTAQKVPGELCVHVELSAREQWEANGIDVTAARFRSLASRPKPHRNCYTSSIVLVGGSTESTRRLMVFVVADEPMGPKKFGSQVSGPAAARILAEALGLTRDGEVPRHDLVAGFAASDVSERNEAFEPWSLDEEGTW